MKNINMPIMTLSDVGFCIDKSLIVGIITISKDSTEHNAIE